MPFLTHRSTNARSIAYVPGVLDVLPVNPRALRNASRSLSIAGLPQTMTRSHAGSSCASPRSRVKEPSTATELERLSVVIPSIVNTRDFDFKSPEAQELQSHVSSDFLSQIETLPQQEKTLSWAEQVAAWRQRAEEYPAVYFAVASVSSVVDEINGFAQVYVEMEVSGQFFKSG